MFKAFLNRDGFDTKQRSIKLPFLIFEKSWVIYQIQKFHIYLSGGYQPWNHNYILQELQHVIEGRIFNAWRFISHNIYSSFFLSQICLNDNDFKTRSKAVYDIFKVMAAAVWYVRSYI